MAAYATALLLRRRRVAAPPSPRPQSPFPASHSKAAAAALPALGVCLPPLPALLCVYSSKAKAMERVMAAAAVLALLMASALPGAAAHSEILHQDGECPKVPGRSYDFALDGQSLKTIENEKNLWQDKMNVLGDSTLSLLVGVQNLEERTKILERALHEVLAGKEPPVDLVAELAGIRKDVQYYGNAVRRHLKLQNSADEQLLSIFSAYMNMSITAARSWMKVVGFVSALVIGAFLLLSSVDLYRVV